MLKTPIKQVHFKDDEDVIPERDKAKEPVVPKTSTFGFLHRKKKTAPKGAPEKVCPAQTPEKPSEVVKEAKLQYFDKLNFMDYSVKTDRAEETKLSIATAESSSYVQETMFHSFDKLKLMDDYSVKSDHAEEIKNVIATGESGIFGGPRPNYTGFLKSKNTYFCLEPIKDAPKVMVKRPLGVTYDEMLKQWLVADTNNHRVLVVPSNKSFKGDLRKPGAITVYEPGVSFVVVDDNGMYLFNHGNDRSRVIADFNHPARGVAVTSHGNIITMQQFTHNRNSQHIVVYKGAGYNEVIYSLAYSAGRSPSFIDFHKDELTITDLSNQIVSIYQVKEEKGGIVEINLLNEMRAAYQPGHTVESGKFRFVSGVHQDATGLRIIADADQHCLYLFDRLGPVQRISCTEALPYTSGLWINMNGEVALCDRQGSSIRFYQLVGIPKKLDHIDGVQRVPYQASAFNNRR